MLINRLWVVRKRPESRTMDRSETEASRWLAVTFIE